MFTVMVLRIKGLFVMSGINVVFDTCAIIKLLQHRYTLDELEIDIAGSGLLTSVIVRMELLSKPGLSADEEQNIRNFLGDLVVVPLDEAIEQKAVEIRRSTSLKLPDSIVAATSIVLGAVLLTDDARLLQLSRHDFKAQAVYRKLG